MKEWTPRRVTLALLAGVFISTFPRFLMPPMLLAMAADFGTTLTTITLAASAYFFVYGLAQPLWGLVSDRIGRVRTMRTALVLAAIGDLASTIPMPVEAFVVVRGLSGAFMAGVFPAAIIYIGDAVKDPRQRQPVIATLMSGVAIGITLGTLLGGLGVGTLGWRPMFWIAAGGSLLVSWSVRRLPEPVREPAPPVREAFRIVLSSGWSWVLYALVFVEAGVLLGGFAMIPASIEVAGGTPAVAGLLTASYGLSVLAMSAAARRASAHVAAARLLVVGGVGAVLGFGLLAIGLSAPLVVASVVLKVWPGSSCTRPCRRGPPRSRCEPGPRQSPCSRASCSSATRSGHSSPVWPWRMPDRRRSSSSRRSSPRC
ncbi:MAG: MFS transporter [Candidatus Nanopelagicales bacterium]